MVGVAGFFVLAMAVAPAPTPTPLKEIIHLRVSPFCQTFQENVRHAVEGLLVNDQIIAKSKPLFVKMGADWRNGSSTESTGLGNLTSPSQSDHRSAAIQLDNSRLEQLIGSIVHNLQVIDDLLKDPTRFPKDSNSANDKQLAALKLQIQAAADEQRKALNVLSGVVDTYGMEDIYGRGDPIVSSNGQGGGKDKALTGSNSFFDGGPMATASDAANPALSDSALGNTPFARFYAAVLGNQNAIMARESALAGSLVQAAPSCASS